MDRRGYKIFVKIGSAINSQDFHEAIRVSQKPWMILTDEYATYDDYQAQFSGMTLCAREFWKRAEKAFVKDKRIDALAEKFKKVGGRGFLKGDWISILI